VESKEVDLTQVESRMVVTEARESREKKGMGRSQSMGRQ
jgi:hypothetical protein